MSTTDPPSSSRALPLVLLALLAGACASGGAFDSSAQATGTSPHLFLSCAGRQIPRPLQSLWLHRQTRDTEGRAVIGCNPTDPHRLLDDAQPRRTNGYRRFRTCHGGKRKPIQPIHFHHRAGLHGPAACAVCCSRRRVFLPISNDADCTSRI